MNRCIKCGSYAFNLYKEGIDQGGLCDVHYWQGRAHRAEALAQQSNEQVEPAFWYSAQEDEFMAHKIRKEHERLNSYTHKVGKFDLPLYTHPPVPYVVEPRTAQPKPLTDEQIDAAIKNSKKVDTGYAGWVRDQRREFGRAIEVAHGIKE